jgi:hypothetical protein
VSLDVYLTVNGDEVFSANYTHNCGTMADAAGIYKHLWRPDEIGITKAQELIAPLCEGIRAMSIDPAKFEALNPENGWGSYATFVPWVFRYWQACCRWPDADVSVSR